MTGQRSDFTRNERRIVDAAARLLAARPSTGMSEIAAAAGLGRATLYRHFPTREALIAGLRAEAADAVDAVLARHGAAAPADAPAAGEPAGAPASGSAGAGGGRPADGFATLVEELLDVGERYRIVFADGDDERTREEARRRFELPLTALVEQAQARGELDRELPPQWIVVALRSVLEGLLAARADGRIGGADARRLAVRALLCGVGAPDP